MTTPSPFAPPAPLPAPRPRRVALSASRAVRVAESLVLACVPLALPVLGRGPSAAAAYHIIVELGCSRRGDTSEERRNAFRPAIPHFHAQHSITSHKLPALAKPAARPGTTMICTFVPSGGDGAVPSPLDSMYLLSKRCGLRLVVPPRPPDSDNRLKLLT
jgi:hypothetical protein